MATVPADAQRAAKIALFNYIYYTESDIGYTDEKDPQPLLYYLLADEKDQSDIRGLSAEWCLTLYAKGSARFCDFHGFPGDNESGGGIYWRDDRPEDMLAVFMNGDGLLYSNKRRYGRLVTRFEKYRRDEAPDTESDPNTESDADTETEAT